MESCQLLGPVAALVVAVSLDRMITLEEQTKFRNLVSNQITKSNLARASLLRAHVDGACLLKAQHKQRGGYRQ